MKNQVQVILIGLLILGCSSETKDPYIPGLQRGNLNTIIVVVSDHGYMAGALSVVNLTGDNVQRVEKNKASAHTDSVIRWSPHTNHVYVINRYGKDSITVREKDTLKIVNEFSVGKSTIKEPERRKNGSNPQDIVVIGDVGYISFYGAKNIVKVSLPDGNILKRIDLSHLADSDGYPEMGEMTLVGKFLYVPVKRMKGMSPATENVTIGGVVEKKDLKGILVVIDTETDTIHKEIELMGSNPVGKVHMDAIGSLYVAEAGKTGYAHAIDGGIEKFDSNLRSLGYIIEESDFGGDIFAFEILRKDVGVAIILANNGKHTRFVRFNPQTKKVTKVILDPKNYTFVDLLWDSERNLIFLADRDVSNGGIRTFRADTLEELPVYHYNVGLLPVSMTLSW